MHFINYRARQAKILLLFLVPHHALSRVVYWIARYRHIPFLIFMIRWFIQHYHVNMSEALPSNPKAYSDFNSFFTRALRPESRSIVREQAQICCPVDGTISQFGGIQGPHIFQAKDKLFSLIDILGGSGERTRSYVNGQFVTMYLSPGDYHRIHMPLSGQLIETVYIPGRLFSVSPEYTESVSCLFVKNERVACIFETQVGLMAVILVGAIFVGSIETVWAGEITPSNKKSIIVTNYLNNDKLIKLERGEELGRFNMGGSTVIVLFGTECMKWLAKLEPGSRVKFGQALAHIEEQPSD